MRAFRYAVLLLAPLLAACLGEAERGNPLDPLSDNFRDAGTVVGAVTNVFAPFEGLPGARVHLTPLGGGPEQVVRADATGQFRFEAVPSGTYVLLAEAEGYAATTDTLTVAVGVLAETALRLDGVPIVPEQSVRTEHISRWFPQDDLYQLVVEAQVDDPDGLGDLVRVELVIPDLDFRDSLTAVVGEPGRYRRVFSEAALSVRLQDLLSRPLYVETTDQAGVTGRAQSAQIVRIIEVVPLAVSPVSLQVVGPTPELVWAPVSLPYSFTFRLDVIFVPTPGQQILVASYEGLPSTMTAFMVPTGLPVGDYSWTVSVVDAFGNRSRSREGGFRVLVPTP